MNERMTVAEAKRRFPDEHVVFIAQEKAPNGEVLAGVLVGHAPRLRDLREIIREHRNVAVFWTGEAVSPVLWALQRQNVVG